MLVKSLKGETFIPLGLYERPTLVTNSFTQSGRILGAQSRLFIREQQLPRSMTKYGPSSCSLSASQVREDDPAVDVGSRSPGSRRFSADNPMPVVFNLSAWAEKHQQLEEWLIAELVTRYKIGPTTAKSWITDNQIMPMLDGLDEVGAEHRNACVHAINTYWLNHQCGAARGGQPIFGVSALDTKLVGSRAVQVQPMTPEQVADYLANDVVEFKALQAIVREQPLFQELAQNPLMLSILKRTYAGRAIQIDQNASLEEQSRQIFTDYVDTMLRRGKAKAPYTPQQTKDWLFWLSRQCRPATRRRFLSNTCRWTGWRRLYRTKCISVSSWDLFPFLVTFAADTILFEDWGIGGDGSVGCRSGHSFRLADYVGCAYRRAALLSQPGGAGPPSDCSVLPGTSGQQPLFQPVRGPRRWLYGKSAGRLTVRVNSRIIIRGVLCRAFRFESGN